MHTFNHVPAIARDKRYGASRKLRQCSVSPALAGQIMSQSIYFCRRTVKQQLVILTAWLVRARGRVALLLQLRVLQNGKVVKHELDPTPAGACELTGVASNPSDTSIHASRSFSDNLRVPVGVMDTGISS